MNARAIKAKGRDAENAVVEFLRLHGFSAERRRLTGVEDCGDISGIKGVVLEVKNEKTINLAGYMEELETEIVNATLRFEDREHTGAAVVKRRGKGTVGDWYAVVPMRQFVELIKLWELRRVGVDGKEID